jgi:tetratricopeptide (TPR) repeat protein
MNTRLIWTAAAALGIASSALHAQGNAPAKWADTVSREIDNAQVSGDTARLSAAVALSARVAAAYPDDGLIQHYYAYAIYRQLTARGNMRPESAPRAKEALDILERSIKLRPLAESYMLVAMLDGQLIAAEPSRSAELGMASQSATGGAMALGRNNARVALMRGQSAIFTPPEYGGGLPVAEELLKQAIDLFAKDKPGPGEPSWGKAEVYLWLGQVYLRQGARDKAKAALDQALQIAPNYSFARAQLAAISK